MSAQESPLNRNRLKRICRNPVLTVVLLLFGISFPFALPVVVSVGWHATHSSVQKYGGYEIRVPWRYFMFRRGDSAWLMRMRDVPERRLYKFAVVTLTPGSERLDIYSWQKQVVRAFEQHGVKVSGIFDSSMGGVPVACIQQTVNQPEFKYFVVCRGGDGSRVEYMGDVDGLRQFRSILRGIMPVGK